MHIQRFAILSSLGTMALFWGAAAGASWVNSVHGMNMRSSSSFISFSTTEPMQNPAGCGRSDIYVVNSSVDYKSALAILLSAYSLGTTVSIYLGATCDPSTGAPLVTDVMIN